MKRMFNTHPFGKAFFKPVISGICTAAIVLFISRINLFSPSGIENIVLIAALPVIYFGALILLKPDKEDIQIIHHLMVIISSLFKSGGKTIKK